MVAKKVEGRMNALKDEDEDVRERAARALGRIGGVRAVEPLIQALSDKAFVVRSAAAEALGKIADLRAVEPLIQALHDKNSYVRNYSAKALDKLLCKPSNDSEKALYLIAKQEWDAAVASGQPAVDPFIQLLKNYDWEVRVSAVRALGLLRDKRAVEPLLALLEHDCPNVIDEAIHALGEIGDDRAVEPILEVGKHYLGKDTMQDWEELAWDGDMQGTIRIALGKITRAKKS